MPGHGSSIKSQNNVTPLSVCSFPCPMITTLVGVNKDQR